MANRTALGGLEASYLPPRYK